MPICPTCKGEFPQGQFCPKDGTALVGDDAAAQAAATDPLLGTVVADRFRIVRKLGAGGMGSVYEAKHLYIDKRVALKLLNPEITANAEAVSRFQREAMSTSTIGHENIVGIDDFGRLPNGLVYLTMDYLEGAPLTRVVADGALEVVQVLDLATQICHGLAAAHAKGIIHRDIKGDNIYLVEGGSKVKILDFGIAKVMGSNGDSSNLTKTGAVFGTPHYMAPEQALGKPVDHRADIYSVGVLLYEMLAGHVPFTADSFMAVLTKHITEAPIPVSEAAPHREIPAEVEALVMRAMEKEPDARFPDMVAMVEELKRLRAAHYGAAPAHSYLNLSRLAPPGSPSTSTGTTGRPSTNPTAQGELMAPVDAVPRKRGMVAMLAIGAIAIAAGVGGYLYLRVDRVAGGTSVVEAELAAVSEREVAANVVGGGAGGAETPTPTSTSTGESAAGGEATKPAATDEGAREVKILVNSVPQRAEIVIDGEVVGRTPDLIAVKAGEPLDVVVRRRGYVDKRITVDGETGDKLNVRLKRKPAARKRPRRPVRKKRRKPSEPMNPYGEAPVNPY